MTADNLMISTAHAEYNRLVARLASSTLIWIFSYCNITATALIRYVN